MSYTAEESLQAGSSHTGTLSPRIFYLAEKSTDRCANLLEAVRSAMQQTTLLKRCMPLPTSGCFMQADLFSRATYMVSDFSQCIQQSHSIEPSLGLFDARHVMCLFDPQGHTYVSTSFVADWLLLLIISRQNARRKTQSIFGGRQDCDYSFFQEHDPNCDSNWVCNALGLATLEVKVMQSAVPTKPLRHGMVDLRLVRPQANHVVTY